VIGQAPGQHACPNGHPIRPSARFCPACGARVPDPADETSLQHAPPAPDPSWPSDPASWPPADAGAWQPTDAGSPQPTDAGSPQPAEVWSWPQAGAGAPQQAVVAATPQRSWTPIIIVVAVLLLLGAGGGVGGVYLSRRADSAPIPAPAPTPTITPTPTPSTDPSESASADPSTNPSISASDPGATSVGIVNIAAVRADARADRVGWTLNEYYSGINSRDIERTLAVMDPAGVVNRNDPGQAEKFRVDVSTTIDSNIVVHSIADDGAGGLQALVTFTSQQDSRYGPNGQTCTNWSLTYLFTATADGQLLIRRTVGTNTPC
jgi:hypothetical protein